MNFIRFYDRKGAITSLLEKVELESSGVLGGVGQGLRSLELRTSPCSNKDAQISALTGWQNQINRLRGDVDWRGLRSLELQTGPSGDEDSQHAALTRLQNQINGPRSDPDWGDLECGFVLHFLKCRGDHVDTGHPRAADADNFADPSFNLNTMHYRWQSFVTDGRQQADALAAAIEQEPEQLHFLRAIDVCRDEHGVPTWVIAPLFKRVRDRVQIVRTKAYERDRKQLPRLSTTTHVGEDFVHLATGLRYMDEAMDYLPLEAGDRIGHGLALGIDAKKWAEKECRQLMPQEDRWFDLIWERMWHGKLGTKFETDRRTYVDDEIVRLAIELFGEEFDWTPQSAMQFVKKLYDGSLEELGFPNKMLLVDPKSDLDRQLERYMTEPRVYRRCRKVIWVNVEQDGEAVNELQRLVRKRYAEKGITIEVNPISNLMVGDLTDLDSHPLWRLAPGLGKEFGPTLRICVGSDDPLPFATNLPEEYQFLYDSLLLAKKSHAEALVWLEEIRRIGMESRFTVPVP